MSFSSTFLMPKRWSQKGTTIKAPGRPAQARTQSAGPAGAALIVDTHRTPAPMLVADDGAAGDRLASTYVKVCCPHTEQKARPSSGVTKVWALRALIISAHNVIALVPGAAHATTAPPSAQVQRAVGVHDPRGTGGRRACA